MLRLRNNLFELIAVLVAGLCLYCVNIYVVSSNTTYKYAIELWNYGREFFHILYPFVFSVPFCWVLFQEKNGAYWKNVFNRVSLNKYIQKRILLAIVMSAITMLIVSFGSLLFAYLIGQGTVSDYEPIMSAKFYGLYQINHPVSYAFVLSCWRSFLAVLYTVLGIGITMLSKNVFIAMTGAFVYSIVENFITAILQVPELSITTSFYPNRLSGTNITFPKLMVGPTVILVVIVAIYLYYCKNIKHTLMD